MSAPQAMKLGWITCGYDGAVVARGWVRWPGTLSRAGGAFRPSLSRKPMLAAHAFAPLFPMTGQAIIFR